MGRVTVHYRRRCRHKAMAGLLMRLSGPSEAHDAETGERLLNGHGQGSTGSGQRWAVEYSSLCYGYWSVVLLCLLQCNCNYTPSLRRIYVHPCSIPRGKIFRPLALVVPGARMGSGSGFGSGGGGSLTESDQRFQTHNTTQGKWPSRKILNATVCAVVAPLSALLRLNYEINQIGCFRQTLWLILSN